jgi:hypothetical protein
MRQLGGPLAEAELFAGIELAARLFGMSRCQYLALLSAITAPIDWHRAW